LIIGPIKPNGVWIGGNKELEVHQPHFSSFT